MGLKRCFDFVGALIGLVLTIPLTAAIALCILVSQGRPVLFSQTRPGFKGRPFRLLKFRSMSDARGPGGVLLPDGERLTRFGRFLRATSLDELPELWNVLVGDMSFVGPRPLLMEYLPLYTAAQARRHEVRPGLTGWAQVNGRNALPWQQRFELDIWYVDHRSFWLDLRIMALTVRKVLSREGISEQGHVTATKFPGNSA